MLKVQVQRLRKEPHSLVLGFLHATLLCVRSFATEGAWSPGLHAADLVGLACCEWLPKAPLPLGTGATLVLLLSSICSWVDTCWDAAEYFSVSVIYVQRLLTWLVADFP
jgi:hypothetical protein